MLFRDVIELLSRTLEQDSLAGEMREVETARRCSAPAVARRMAVAAMRDAEVNAAKQKVMDVSGRLSDIINEFLDDEDDLSDLR